MGLTFWRIYQSINYTFEWFESSRIVLQTRKMSGGLNLDYLNTYYDVTLRWHQHMKDEIFQTINTCDEKTQVYMFEELLPYLRDFRICSLPTSFIEQTIKGYNDSEEYKFNERVKEKDKEHRAKVDYTKPHLLEYLVEKPAGHSIFGGYYPKRTVPVTNNYFYEIWDTPDLIDTDILPDYYDFLQRIQRSFIDNTSLYTRLYQEGKYVPKDKILILKEEIDKEIKHDVKELPTSPDQALLPQNPAMPGRLKLSISVEQFAVLMRMLKDVDIITSDKKDIHNFVADHIQTVGRSDERISTKNFGKLYSSKDASIINFWLGRLAKMGDSLTKK